MGRANRAVFEIFVRHEWPGLPPFHGKGPRKARVGLEDELPAPHRQGAREGWVAPLAAPVPGVCHRAEKPAVALLGLRPFHLPLLAEERGEGPLGLGMARMGLGVAAPAVVLGALHDAGADGVAVDVGGHGGPLRPTFLL